MRKPKLVRVSKQGIFDHWKLVSENGTLLWTDKFSFTKIWDVDGHSTFVRKLVEKLSHTNCRIYEDQALKEHMYDMEMLSNDVELGNLELTLREEKLIDKIEANMCLYDCMYFRFIFN